MTGALLCAAAFAMSLQPPENPATAGPLPGSIWFLVLLIAFFLSLPLAVMPVVLPVAVLIYLRGVALAGWRWLIAWAVAAAACLVVEVLLVRAVLVDVGMSAAPPTKLAPPSVGPARGELTLAIGFMAAGAAMTAVITLAVRSARRGGSGEGASPRAAISRGDVSCGDVSRDDLSRGDGEVIQPGDRGQPGIVRLVGGRGTRRLNPLAVASFVLGLTGLLFGPLACAAGLVSGVVALRQVRRHDDGGEGLAIAGVVISAVQIASTVLFALVMARAGTPA